MKTKDEANEDAKVLAKQLGRGWKPVVQGIPNFPCAERDGLKVIYLGDDGDGEDAYEWSYQRRCGLSDSLEDALESAIESAEAEIEQMKHLRSLAKKAQEHLNRRTS